LRLNSFIKQSRACVKSHGLVKSVARSNGFRVNVVERRASGSGEAIRSYEHIQRITRGEIALQPREHTGSDLIGIKRIETSAIL